MIAKQEQEIEIVDALEEEQIENYWSKKRTTQQRIKDDDLGSISVLKTESWNNIMVSRTRAKYTRIAMTLSMQEEGKHGMQVGEEAQSTDKVF